MTSLYDTVVRNSKYFGSDFVCKDMAMLDPLPRRDQRCWQMISPSRRRCVKLPNAGARSAARAYGFQQQEASSEMQAMSGKIMREVSEGLQWQASGIKLAEENETLKARVKELESKPAK